MHPRGVHLHVSCMARLSLHGIAKGGADLFGPDDELDDQADFHKVVNANIDEGENAVDLLDTSEHDMVTMMAAIMVIVSVMALVTVTVI